MPDDITFSPANPADANAGAASALQNAEAEWEKIQKNIKSKRRGREIISIVHRDFDTGGLLLNADYHHLTHEEALDIASCIRNTPKGKPIDLILHTRGGDAAASELIAEVILKRSRVVAYVPYMAMSGGTQIALAADLVVFGSNACLGPTDLLLGGISVHDWAELQEMKTPDKLDDISALAIILSKKRKDKDLKKTCDLINNKHKKMVNFYKRDCSLAEIINGGSEPHETRIKYKDAKKHGIKCIDRMHSIYYEYVDIRRQHIRQMRISNQASYLNYKHLATTTKTEGSEVP
ncbi:MAG: hypothetical protein KIS81_00435 [Maricaulaceae bacterium]|nr:hypothetical protein [Maricaulaceae bacterium]